jgi:hypothetical protein
MTRIQLLLAKLQAIVGQLSGLMTQGSTLWRQVSGMAKERRQ